MPSIQSPGPGRSCPIENLPVEVVTLILCALPDATTLRAVVLASPTFYYAALRAKFQTLRHVVYDRIDPKVMSSAATALKSSWLPSCKVDERGNVCEEVISFKNEHLVNAHMSLSFAELFPEEPSLFQGLQLGCLHTVVADLTQQFIHRALSECPDAAKYGATRSEICRIQQTFYRFEAYCNLFRGEEGDREVMAFWRLEGFFDMFQPWEIEQLACVQDFLFRMIKPAYYEFVEHDICWGFWGVSSEEDVNSPKIQYLLSRGLMVLQRLAAAKTYEERRWILAAHAPPESNPSFLGHFFRDTVEEEEEEEEEEDEVYLDEDEWESRFGAVDEPSPEHPEVGPVVAWKWAHMDEALSDFVYAPQHCSMRRQGYVMWDQSRLQPLGYLDTPWLECSWRKKGSDLTQRRSNVENASALVLQNRRKVIYLRGGYGWWDAEDESRVRWQKGRKFLVMKPEMLTNNDESERPIPASKGV